MAVTAAGTPYVETSDLVANYPGVSLALANHIDTIGKILQVVRATDVTQRDTTSTSFVDVTGMSVTITPQKIDSALMIIANFMHFQQGGATDTRGDFQLTDSSNATISGAEQLVSGLSSVNTSSLRSINMIGYVEPATLSAVTYKLRFSTRNSSSTATVYNNINTGQMYAIEVSA